VKRTCWAHGGRRFLLEYLVGERNFAANTRRSYRDTLSLLIPFIATSTSTTVDRLTVDHISADRIRRFLGYLEEARHCGIATRNQRLAAIHSLARYIGERSPEHLVWCSDVCRIPFKRAPREAVSYLEKPEIDALLDAPDRTTRLGFRITQSSSFSTTPARAPMKSLPSPSATSTCPIHIRPPYA